MKQEPYFPKTAISGRPEPFLSRLAAESDKPYVGKIVIIALLVVIVHVLCLTLTALCLHIKKQHVPLYAHVEMSFQDTPKTVPALDMKDLGFSSFSQPVLPVITGSMPVLLPQEKFQKITAGSQKRIVIRKRKKAAVPQNQNDSRIPDKESGMNPLSDHGEDFRHTRQVQTDQAFIKNHCNAMETVYPLAARKRHEQGVAKISVQILGDGQVNAVHLATSTGYQSLDDAAMKAVRTLKCQSGEESARKEMNILIPVVFTLH